MAGDISRLIYELTRPAGKVVPRNMVGLHQQTDISTHESRDQVVPHNMVGDIGGLIYQLTRPAGKVVPRNMAGDIGGLIYQLTSQEIK